MSSVISPHPWSKKQRVTKRFFDIIFSAFGLIILSPVIVLCIIMATIDTKLWGIFSQKRVGQYGKRFSVYKIRTMLPDPHITHHITSIKDPRITSLGAFFRRTKLDELPQLWNVLIGQMSLVGPRPDVPGLIDQLNAKDQIVLAIKPGITGPASLVFYNEEKFLAAAEDLEAENARIFARKVVLNIEYIHAQSLRSDITYIIRTVFR